MALIIDPEQDTTFYDSVRRLLGGVDEEVLPNEDINDESIISMAEFQVLDLVPNYDELTDNDKSKVRLATIHVIASLLCPTMSARVDVEVRTIEVTWKRRPVDYGELEQSLMAKALTLLEGVMTTEDGSGRIFAVAPSKRAVRDRAK